MGESLVFNSELHEYSVGGVVCPNVTSVILSRESFTGVSHEVMERAGHNGTTRHLATALSDMGLLDTRKLDDRLIPYLKGWHDFCVDYSVKMEQIELKLFSPIYGDAGTIDRIATMDYKKRRPRVVIDIKTGTVYLKTMALQLTRYLAMYNENYPEAKATKRLIVWLLKNGKYKLQWIPYVEDNERQYNALLTNTHWRNANNLENEWAEYIKQIDTAF